MDGIAVVIIILVPTLIPAVLFSIEQEKRYRGFVTADDAAIYS